MEEGVQHHCWSVSTDVKLFSVFFVFFFFSELKFPWEICRVVVFMFYWEHGKIVHPSDKNFQFWFCACGKIWKYLKQLWRETRSLLLWVLSDPGSGVLCCNLDCHPHIFPLPKTFAQSPDFFLQEGQIRWACRRCSQMFLCCSHSQIF